MEVLCWGWGKDGQLGNSGASNQLYPQAIGDDIPNVSGVSCGGEHSTAVTSDGVLYTWGGGKCGQLGHGDWKDQCRPCKVRFFSGQRVLAVACGSFYTAAVTDNYDLYTWGCGRDGQLGHGDRSSPKSPKIVDALVPYAVIQVACGEYHASAIVDDGEHTAA